MVLILALVVAVLLCCTEIARAETIEEADAALPSEGLVQYAIHMKPGQTYDCTNAKMNTTVYIESAGTYRLKGKSRYVRVSIDGGNVEVKLADGLNLNCCKDTYGNVRTSPININETGGTVTLISEKNANVYFEGYLAPAIRKEGRKTGLHFETEDPNNPGTIIAHTNKSNPSAGIGSVMYLVRPGEAVGNITINSGNIIAEGGNDSAGIGGGYFKSLNDLTINGGNVTATSYGGGAAIGGGQCMAGKNITINGGTVHAESKGGNGGAAIGGGAEDSVHNNNGYNGENITINGGSVKATTRGMSAAIGGGDESDGKNITINGGYVYAYTKPDMALSKNSGSAIGGGYGTWPGRAVNINITGGTIIAKTKGDGVPIGDSRNSDPHVKSSVHISGGTILADGDKKADLGVYNGETVITGGSIYAKNTHGTIINSNKQPLHKVDVSFDGVTEDNLPISDVYFNSSYDYGMHDVLTSQGGKFFPWLPKDTSDNSIIAADLNKEVYFGKILFSDKSGKLSRVKEMTIVPEVTDQGLGHGYAYAIYGQPKLRELRPPDSLRGHHIAFYKLYNDMNNRRIANADGTFFDTVSGYTKDGLWDRKYDPNDEVVLQAVPATNKYKVKFDPNKPKTASTAITGEMSDMDMEYGNTKELDYNQFKLPGYVFTGWNTKADGTGTSYTDNEGVKNLTEDNDVTVTLYAQWLPISYQVNFKANGGSGSMDPVQMTFDEANQLPECTFTNDGFYFAGWERDHILGSKRHADKDTVVNLCGSNPTVPDSGDLEIDLVAIWIPDTHVTIGVVDDDSPVTGLEVKLIDESGGEEITLPEDPSTPGYYTVKQRDVTQADDEGQQGAGDGDGTDPTAGSDEDTSVLLEGTYSISVKKGSETYDTEGMVIKVEVGKGALKVLQFCSVSIAGEDEHIDAWISSNGTKLSSLSKLPEGAGISINSSVAEGYSFDSYTAAGVSPAWDPAEAEQTITINGQADIMAHAKANLYHVKFEPNGGNGKMEVQDMVYDEPQDLFANQFTRKGYTFAGWNTKANGTGTSYQDGENVKNLVTSGTVTLYAVWSTISYRIEYELDGGVLPDGTRNPYIYTAASKDFTLVNPTMKDHVFQGWIGTGLKKPTKTVTIKKGSTGDRSYTAVWSLIQYKVNFVTNGGSKVASQSVEKGSVAKKPKDPTRSGYTFAGWYKDKALTKAFAFSTKINADTTLYAKWTANPVPVLIAQGQPKGKRAIKTSWTKVPGASKYLVYGAKCGDKLKRIKVTTKNSFKVRKIKGKKLRKHSPYIFCVVAIDKNGKVIAISKNFHVIAAKTMGDCANIKTITADKKSITLSKGKSVKVGAKVTLPKGKKHISKKHGAKLRFTSDNPKVASVDKKGNVKAKYPGKATIYIQDTCGKYCTTVVTVK